MLDRIGNPDIARSRPRRTVDRRRRRRVRFAAWALGVAAAPASAAAIAAALGLAPVPAAAVALLVWLVAADRFMRAPGGVPVLTYHSVSAAPEWLPWAGETSVTPETFERHLRTLARMGCSTIDTIEFVRLRRGGEPVPADAVMLHIDDGYLDTWVAAAPLLRRHGVRATAFVSLDFVEPDCPPRATIDTAGAALRWDGYMSWREIRALDSEGVVSIEAHGVDHGRVATGPRTVDTVRPDNWRRLAWVQWAASAGPKHDWYRKAEPEGAPYGSPVPESDGALAARAWNPDGVESEGAYAARVRRDLIACVDVLVRELGRPPRLFCWPQNLSSPLARDIADAEGYVATTGGDGENRAGEDSTVVSRMHMGDRAVGFRWPWMEGLALRATVRLAQGNYYWFGPLAAMHAARRRLLPRTGSGGRPS